MSDEYLEYVDHDLMASTIDQFYKREIMNTQFKSRSRLLLLVARLKYELSLIPDNDEVVAEEVFQRCESLRAAIDAAREKLI